MKKLIVFAPFAMKLAGHDESYFREMEKLGVDVDVLLPKDSEITRWNNVLSTDAEKRYAEYCSAFENNQGVFFIEQFGVKELVCIAIAARMKMQKGSMLALLFRRSVTGWKLLFVKALLAMVGNVLLFTDSEIIARDMGLPMKVVPIPHVFQAEEGKAERLMWWPGLPRWEKGLSDIQFLIQHAKGARIALSEAADIHGGEKLPAFLPREQYEEMFAKASIILLPYDPVVYAAGTSGILVEAVVSGKMPVVKEGSWLAFELKRFGLDELIIDWQDVNVVERIWRLFEDEKVQKKLLVMRKAYQEFHCFEGFKMALQDLVVRVGVDETRASSPDREQVLSKN